MIVALKLLLNVLPFAVSVALPCRWKCSLVGESSMNVSRSSFDWVIEIPGHVVVSSKVKLAKNVSFAVAADAAGRSVTEATAESPASAMRTAGARNLRVAVLLSFDGWICSGHVHALPGVDRHSRPVAMRRGIPDKSAVGTHAPT
jgi:hypothetical protein